MSSIKQQQQQQQQPTRVITDTFIPHLEAGDVSFRVKVFPQKKTLIPAFRSKTFPTNIVLQPPLEKFSIWLESDCLHPGIVLSQQGFVSKRSSTKGGRLKIQVYNRQAADILVGPKKFHLGYVQCVPFYQTHHTIL